MLPPYVAADIRKWFSAEDAEVIITRWYDFAQISLSSASTAQLKRTAKMVLQCARASA